MKIKKNALSVCLILLFTYSSFAKPLSELPIHESKYVIFDNDDHRDVYTDEYLLALSHLGNINLIALVTTYSPNKNDYNLFVNGRNDIVKKAEKSEMQHLPKVFAGTHDRLVKPVSNKIEDTRPLDIEASRFVVKQAKYANSEHPLVFVTGGQLTVIANAYLIDPTIVDKVIVSGVFGVRELDYNGGLDSWAWKIVLSKFRVLAIPIGPSSQRGTVYMKPPVVTKADIYTKLPQELPLFQWMYQKHHPTNSLPDDHDYDGQAAIPIIRPDYITKIKRWSVEGIDMKGNLELIEDSSGKIYEALDADQKIATEEFWRAMNLLAASIKKK